MDKTIFFCVDQEHAARMREALVNEFVSIAHEQIQFFDEHGKLVTKNFIDYTCNKIKNSYSTLKDFLTAWDSAEHKKIIIDTSSCL